MNRLYSSMTYFGPGRNLVELKALLESYGAVVVALAVVVYQPKSPHGQFRGLASPSRCPAGSNAITPMRLLVNCAENHNQ